MLAILKIHKITRKSAATTAAACFTDYPAIVNYSIWSYYYVTSFLILINILNLYNNVHFTDEEDYHFSIHLKYISSVEDILHVPQVFII